MTNDIEARVRACCHDPFYMDSCYLCTLCLKEQQDQAEELARVKQELTEALKAHTADIRKYSDEKIGAFERGKEAGALSMAQMIDDSGRAAYDGPVIWMQQWRKREAKQDE